MLKQVGNMELEKHRKVGKDAGKAMDNLLNFVFHTKFRNQQKQFKLVVTEIIC